MRLRGWRRIRRPHGRRPWCKVVPLAARPFLVLALCAVLHSKREPVVSCATKPCPLEAPGDPLAACYAATRTLSRRQCVRWRPSPDQSLLGPFSAGFSYHVLS